MLTRGVLLALPDGATRRGAEIEALVTVSDPAAPGELEVGLVCTETYEKMDWVSRGPDESQSYERVTVTTRAYEEWQPLEMGVGTETVRLRVPVEAPFSYKGMIVSFKWELVARAHKHHRLDKEVAQEFSVLP